MSTKTTRRELNAKKAKATKARKVAAESKKKLRRAKIAAQRKLHAKIANNIQRLGEQVAIEEQAALPETISSIPFECEELNPTDLFLRHNGDRISRDPEGGESPWSSYLETIADYCCYAPPPPNKTVADREGFYFSVRKRVSDDFYDYMWLYAGGGLFYRSKAGEDNRPVRLQLKRANLKDLEKYKNIWCYVNPLK